MTERGVPQIELDPRDWEIVRDILARLVPQHEVWAFGSRARRTAKMYSDLDLAVIADQRLDWSLRSALAEAFDESDLTIKVDVVDWATTSAAFRRIIEQDKVVVQKSNAASAADAAPLP